MSIQYIRGQLTDIDSTLYDASLNEDGLIVRVSKTNAIAPLPTPNIFALSCLVQGDGTAWFNTGTVAIPVWTAVGTVSGPSVSGTITSPEILALRLNPVTILPAPGVGFAYFVVSARAKLNYGTAPYVPNPRSNFQLGTGSLMWLDFSVFIQEPSQVTAMADAGNSVGLPYILQENTALIWQNTDVTDFINGDSTVDYYIEYAIIAL